MKYVIDRNHLELSTLLFNHFSTFRAFAKLGDFYCLHPYGDHVVVSSSIL